jgi:hypothetical protein
MGKRKDQIRVETYIPDSSYSKLKQAAELNDISVSHIVRSLIEKFLESYVFEDVK